MKYVALIGMLCACVQSFATAEKQKILEDLVTLSKDFTIRTIKRIDLFLE